MPNPPTSVGPRSRRNSNLAHAVGLNRSFGWSGRGFDDLVHRRGLVFRLTASFASFIEQALLTKVVAAVGAARQTATAVGVITAVASTTALGTAVVIAIATTDRTLAAGRATTARARAEVIAVDGIAAVGATTSRPLFESDVGAAGVVRLQNLSHEQKEVTQPSLLQSGANRGLAVPFTQRLALDMWMWDIVMARGRVRFESNDFIRSRLIEPVPMQHNLKRPQADLFQRDRIGHDGDRVLLQVAVELTEFGLQGIEFVVHLPQVQQRFRRLVRQAVDLAAASLNVPRKNPHCAFEVPEEFFRGSLPTTLSGDEQLSSQLLSTFPFPLRQDWQLRFNKRLSQRIKNRRGHPQQRPFDLVGVSHR